MVYLDNFCRTQPKRLPIIRGERRKAIVTEIMDALSDWRFSPWENEGPLQAGVRSSLCSLGHPWADSEREASGLLSAAFQRLAAPARPTWLQGQREYVDNPDACNWCKGELDEMAIERKHKFCSVACARAALHYRDYEKDGAHDRIGGSAYRLIREDQQPPRICQQCSRPYRTLAAYADQKFCSTRCRDASMRIIPDRQCLWCHEVFRPEKMSRTFCSPKCAADHRFAMAVIHKNCACCGTAFTARISTAMYCSNACKKRAFKARTRTAEVIVLRPLTTRTFDNLFMRKAA